MLRRSKMNLNAWRIVDRPAPDEPVTATMGCCRDMVVFSPQTGHKAAGDKVYPGAGHGEQDSIILIPGWALHCGFTMSAPRVVRSRILCLGEKPLTSENRGPASNCLFSSCSTNTQ